jgi:2-polyprenyl-3-methyl-5-hydroxy-6-metoxy-1,4-benzoquinol methylase
MRPRTSDNMRTESGPLTHLMNWLVLRAFPEQEVDWERYAQQYDAVTIDLKPAYQRIMKMPLGGELEHLLQYTNADLVCDLGAGTGNLSIPLATRYPDLKVVHIDSGQTYSDIAKAKAERNGIGNIDFHLADAEDVGRIQEQYGKPFDVVLMIHALYSMRSQNDTDKPNRVLRTVYESLNAGGRLCVIDIEREMNLLHLIADGIIAGVRKYGLRRTLSLFKEMDQAKHQNANVIGNQRDGTYITQKVDGLVGMLLKAGFKEDDILYKSGFQHYHGYDNIVVVKK